MLLNPFRDDADLNKLFLLCIFIDYCHQDLNPIVSNHKNSVKDFSL